MRQNSDSRDIELARLRAENQRLTASLAGTDDVLRRAFTAAPLGMAIVALEPPRYVEANDVFLTFLGRTRAEVLAADPYVFASQVTHPDDFAADHALVTRLVAGELDRYELRKRFVRPDGELRWGLLALSAVRAADGALQFIIVQIADVHERTLELERAQQSQKLEAMGQLAGAISHDFNNLLTILMGYGGLLRDQLDADDWRREYATHVIETCARGADLTRQLLSYGRRRVRLPSVFCASQGVATVCELVGRLIGKPIQFSRRLDAAGHVDADQGQVEQVVMNLLLNGRDALPHGGHLSIETDDVALAAGEVESVPPGRYVRIRVSDDGTGISPTVRRQMFEPFFTTKAPGKGTGLGLSTVWGIVNESGGAITVTSAPNQGSRFDVFLPRVEPRRDVSPSSAPGQRPHRAATILLAEEDPAVSRLMAEVLRTACYTVLVAGSAERALDIARTTKLDLVVTNMVTPLRRGLDLVQELRREKPTLRTLIAASHTEQAAGLAASLAPGDYLFKPFIPGVLLDRVRDILG